MFDDYEEELQMLEEYERDHLMSDCQHFCVTCEHNAENHAIRLDLCDVDGCDCDGFLCVECLA